MKLTLQLQLLPDLQQADHLKSTIVRFNQACSWLAEQAFEMQTANKTSLRKRFYYELRDRFGMSSQMACLCARHVAGTYKQDKSILPVFRPNAAMPYDSRILSFKGIDRVSILTLEGRLIIPFVMGKYQRERFSLAKGECDLVRRKDGQWFLLVTADVPEGTEIAPTEFIGVDFGVVNLATDNDGDVYTNTETEKVRQKRNKVRRSLGQRAGKVKREGSRPKNIKRKLKALSSKERRFKANENHRISKRIAPESHRHRARDRS